MQKSAIPNGNYVLGFANVMFSGALVGGIFTVHDAPLKLTLALLVTISIAITRRYFWPVLARTSSEFWRSGQRSSTDAWIFVAMAAPMSLGLLYLIARSSNLVFQGAFLPFLALSLFSLVGAIRPHTSVRNRP